MHQQRRNERQADSDFVDAYAPRKSFHTGKPKLFKPAMKQEPELSAFEKLPASSKIHVSILSRIMLLSQDTQDLLTRYPTLRALYYKTKPNVVLGDKPSFDMLEDYAEQMESRFKAMRESLV